MTKKTMLLAASALAALAFAALPAMASAAPTIHFSTANPTFSGTFGKATLTAVGQEEIVCDGENHVNGQWTTKVEGGKNTGTTGTIEITFTNCHVGPLPCTTSGQASGTITTGTSEFHLVYIKGFSKTVGTLVTPPTGGTFAAFACTVFASVKVTGNGIIGHVSTPKCGEKSASSTTSFTSSAKGVQTYKEVEGSAVVYSLKSSLNGGGAVEASEDIPTATTTLGGGATGELTCL
jgi:hypothetical protein